MLKNVLETRSNEVSIWTLQNWDESRLLSIFLCFGGEITKLALLTFIITWNDLWFEQVWISRDYHKLNDPSGLHLYEIKFQIAKWNNFSNSNYSTLGHALLLDPPFFCSCDPFVTRKVKNRWFNKYKWKYFKNNAVHISGVFLVLSGNFNECLHLKLRPLHLVRRGDFIIYCGLSDSITIFTF